MGCDNDEHDLFGAVIAANATMVIYGVLFVVCARNTTAVFLSRAKQNNPATRKFTRNPNVHIIKYIAKDTYLNQYDAYLPAYGIRCGFTPGCSDIENIIVRTVGGIHDAIVFTLDEFVTVITVWSVEFAIPVTDVIWTATRWNSSIVVVIRCY